MDKETFDYTMERAKVLATADSSKQETKDAANAWIAAVEAAGDDATVDPATVEFLDYLDGRPNAIEGVIEFAKGAAAQIMGQEAADGMLAAALAHKDNGGKYCICDSCTAASEILAKHGRIQL